MFTHIKSLSRREKKKKKISNFKAPYISWVDSIDFYLRSKLLKELPEVKMYEGKDLQKLPFI